MAESREQRISTLAATLKSSGIAKSDSQAKMMAEEMIGVEEHVQKSYEVEHSRATEYLQTAKNLGDSRPAKQPTASVSMVRESPRDRPKPVLNAQSQPSEQLRPASRMIEPIPTNVSSAPAKAPASHDTNNAAIEAIKAQMSKEYIKPLYDRYEELSSKSESQKISPVEVAKEEPAKEPIVQESKKESVIEESKEVPQASSESKEPVKLDAQKLIDMMEEDGKLEEHTREIKEKPKDAKPKEAYVENSIDLGAMFNFNKK